MVSVKLDVDLAPFEKAMKDLGEHVYPRALTFGLNRVAWTARKNRREVLEQELENPTAFTLRSVLTEQVDLKAYERKRHDGRGADMSSRVKFSDEASTYLKYLMGLHDVRHAGDVGLAKDKIWVPIWRNLLRYQLIIPDDSGDLPQTAVPTLVRRMKKAPLIDDLVSQSRTKKGNFSKARFTKLKDQANEDGEYRAGGVFIGRLRRGGAEGIWLRPTPEMCKQGEGPRLLIRFYDKVNAPNILGERIAEADVKAMKLLPGIMEKELKREIRFAKRRAKK